MLKNSALGAALVLLSSALASAQDASDEPIPLPYTRDALKVVYKKGLSLRYVRTTYRKGKPPRRETVLNQVIDHSGKGYLVRTMTFDAAGNAIGKPAQPQAIPYRIESKTFRSAKSYAYERVRLGKEEHSAHKYAYEVQLAGHPGWRTVWYSGKHRGLLLKTITRPTGELGQKNYQTLELVEVPAKLRGASEPVGDPQGNLPWSDAEILAAWPEGGWVEFEVKTKTAQGKQTLRLKRTMIGREPTCYVVREQLWDEEGKLKGDAGRPRLWFTWLRELRLAPTTSVEKLLDRELEAAGRKWPCKVFKVKGPRTVTYYLSKEIPGLTVRYMSEREGVKVERTLSKVGLPVP